jgi:hypothetical protein
MSIQDRFTQLLNHVAPMQKRGKWLEDRTGIPASKWTQLLLGRQNGTPEMLEAACSTWPQYSEWLMTGRAGAKQIQPAASAEHLFNMAVDEMKRSGSKAEFEDALKKMTRAVGIAVTTKQRKNGDQEK